MKKSFLAILLLCLISTAYSQIEEIKTLTSKSFDQKSFDEKIGMISKMAEEEKVNRDFLMTLTSLLYFDKVEGLKTVAELDALLKNINPKVSSLFRSELVGYPYFQIYINGMESADGYSGQIEFIQSKEDMYFSSYKRFSGLQLSDYFLLKKIQDAVAKYTGEDIGMAGLEELKNYDWEVQKDWELYFFAKHLKHRQKSEKLSYYDINKYIVELKDKGLISAWGSKDMQFYYLLAFLANDDKFMSANLDERNGMLMRFERDEKVIGPFINTAVKEIFTNP